MVYIGYRTDLWMQKFVITVFMTFKVLVMSKTPRNGSKEVERDKDNLHNSLTCSGHFYNFY
jgi:hypothetical protein